MNSSFTVFIRHTTDCLNSCFQRFKCTSPYSHCVVQVFEEVLRLYPSSAATVREAPEGLELCGYSIPKGATMMVRHGEWAKVPVVTCSSFQVSSYVMHHRPEVFDDPEKFDPDRFGPDQKR